MKIRNFITVFGLVTLLMGCLVGGVAVKTVESKLMHQSISLASHTVTRYAGSSMSPLSVRQGNPFLEFLYELLYLFERRSA